MNTVIIARGTINPLSAKISRVFKTKGNTVESVSIYEPTDNLKKSFDRCHFLLKIKDKEKQYSNLGLLSTFLSIIKNYRKLLKPLKSADFVIGISEPNIFVSFAFRTKAKKIFFPYDISYLRYEKFMKNKWYDYLFERRNFRKADGIIHKGPKGELGKLPLSFRVARKPHLQFLPYCEHDKMINSDKKHEGIHIVYVGLVYDGVKYPGAISIVEIFEFLANREIHVHVYPSNYEYIKETVGISSLKYHEYFHLHAPLFGDDLRKELSNYHWGLYSLYFDNTVKSDWADTVFGNKVSDYLEAGLPVIATKSLPFVCKVVDDYKIGIVVDNESKMIDAIKTIDYDKIRKETMKNRNKFTIDAHKDEIINFLETLQNE